ncbi:dockerin type I repeat-containing protein, partial [Planctomycetota bacterium]
VVFTGLPLHDPDTGETIPGEEFIPDELINGSLGINAREFYVGEASGLPGRSVYLGSYGEVAGTAEDILTGFAMSLAWQDSAIKIREPASLDTLLYGTIWEFGGEVVLWEFTNPGNHAGGTLEIEVSHPGIEINLDGWPSKRRFLTLIFEIADSALPDRVVDIMATSVVFYGPNEESIIPDIITDGVITINAPFDPSSEESLSIADNYNTLPGKTLSIDLKGRHTQVLDGYSIEIHFDPTLLQIEPPILSVVGTPWENGDIITSEVDNGLGVIQFAVNHPDDVIPSPLNRPRTFLNFNVEVDEDVSPDTVIVLDITAADYAGTAYDEWDPEGNPEDRLRLVTGDGAITVFGSEAIFEFHSYRSNKWYGDGTPIWSEVDSILSYERAIKTGEPYHIYLFAQWNPDLLSYGGSFVDFPGITSIDLDGGHITPTIGEGATLDLSLSAGIWSFTVTPAEPIPDPGPAGVKSLSIRPILRLNLFMPAGFAGVTMPLDLQSGWITWDNGGPQTDDAYLVDAYLYVLYNDSLMTIPQITCAPGETATLAITGDWAMPSVLQFRAGVTFDSEAIQVTNIRFPEGFENYFDAELSVEYNPWSGITSQEHIVLMGRAIDVPGMPGPGSGNLAYIDFEVPLTATAGVYPIDFLSFLGIVVADYVDERGIYTDAEAINGSIEITTGQGDCVPGDANGDGGVNLGDAGYIINWIFYNGPEPDCMFAADANGDGGVNLGDAGYLVNWIFYGGPDPVANPHTH